MELENSRVPRLREYRRCAWSLHGHTPHDPIDFSCCGKGQNQRRACSNAGLSRSPSCSGLKVILDKCIFSSGYEIIVVMTFKVECLQPNQGMNRWKRALENPSAH